VSVGFDFRIDVRPYSGYSDPGLPVAAWIAEAGAVGDASGGIINMDFLFQRDGDAQISELFNLEQMAMDTSSATSRPFSLETVNMDSLAPNRPATDQVWRGSTFDISGLSISAGPINNKLNLPLWLGSPNRNEGDSGLRFQWANVDLLLYFINVQGYMWGPRSVLAEGGPRRPVGGGLFAA